MHATKPLDAGTGRLCASFDFATAAWLSLGAPHDGHGFVEVSAVPPFDERQRGDPAATRRHRLAMTLAEHAFLSVVVDGEPPVLDADPSDPARPRWSGRGVAVDVEADAEAPVIRQRWSVGSGHRQAVRIILRGQIDRPALAEITELDAPAPTSAGTTLTIDRGVARIEADGMPAAAIISVFGCQVVWRHMGDRVIGVLASRIEEAISFTIEASIEPLPAEASRTIGDAIDRTGDRLTDRALTYIRGCTALRLAVDERVILTDHRILPLSWTRDAYWQALALLAADGPADRKRVADHLRWLWRRCERPDGRWVRSHHANGRRKDLAFQADQQLYPLIELADYWRLTGTLPGGVNWATLVPEAWRAAIEEIDPGTDLIATTENAADDPAVAPFIGASQVLLWYASLRVAEVAAVVNLGLGVASVRSVATAVRRGFDTHLGAENGPWPYAVDGHGLRVAYHDANDLPVVLAPVWGFCDAADAAWRTTMAFAFSEANPGWSAGAPAGLGSAHTPGTWTLGDVQAWARARILGERAAADAALARLDEVGFADGMLPEAYGTAMAWDANSVQTPTNGRTNR